MVRSRSQYRKAIRVLETFFDPCALTCYNSKIGVLECGMLNWTNFDCVCATSSRVLSKIDSPPPTDTPHRYLTKIDAHLRGKEGEICSRVDVLIILQNSPDKKQIEHQLGDSTAKKNPVAGTFKMPVVK